MLAGVVFMFFEFMLYTSVWNPTVIVVFLAILAAASIIGLKMSRLTTRKHLSSTPV